VANNSLTEIVAVSATPLLINSKAACAILGIGLRKLWSLTNSKAIPSRKIGVMVRYSPIELAAWIELGCPTNEDACDQVRKAVWK